MDCAEFVFRDSLDATLGHIGSSEAELGAGDLCRQQLCDLADGFVRPDHMFHVEHLSGFLASLLTAESAASGAPCENCTVFPMESVSVPVNEVALVLIEV